MRQINWTITLNEKNELAIAEHAIGFSSENLQDILLQIGVLEDIKQKKLARVGQRFSKTFRKGEDETEN